MNVVKLPTLLQLLRDVCNERSISISFAKRAGLRALTQEQAREASALSWISGPAIEIPYFDQAGKRLDYGRWKLIDHSIKYVSRERSGSRLYYPAGCEPSLWTKPSEPLYVIEGELKTLSAVENLKLHAIGISGVYNFVGRRALSERATPLPDFDQIEWRDRRVVICFDSDWSTNSEVRRALLALGIELSSRGALVEVLQLPSLGSKKTGLDDWIVHTKKQKKALLKAFDEVPRKAFDAAEFFDGLSELEFAKRLKFHFSDQLRYVGEMKKWLVLNQATRVWEEDMTGRAMRMAKQLPTILMREVPHIRSDDRRKEVMKAAISAGNRNRLEAALGLLESEPDIPLLIRQMDRDPLLLALPGGTGLDLKEGSERPLRPDDYVTKIAGTSLGRGDRAGCPLFIKFINQVCLGDAEYVAYIQRALGYSLSGDTSEQCIFIQYGVGANGKSTLLSILRAVLGDYAVQASPETFMVQRGAGTRGDLARLRGARVVATSELEDGQRLAESVIKQFTGGESMVARQLYCEPIEFEVAGKLYLATNHKPKVRGTDHAIWRRIHLWPFDLRLDKKDQDRTILKKLKDELPGILRWMRDGYSEWQWNGLKPPKRVLDATAEYRIESDALGAWMGECCLLNLDESQKTFGPTLYASYVRYTEEKREFRQNQRDFYRLLSEREIPSLDTTSRTKGEKGKFFVGIALSSGSPRDRLSLMFDETRSSKSPTDQPKAKRKTSKKEDLSKSSPNPNGRPVASIADPEKFALSGNDVLNPRRAKNSRLVANTDGPVGEVRVKEQAAELAGIPSSSDTEARSSPADDHVAPTGRPNRNLKDFGRNGAP